MNAPITLTGTVDVWLTSSFDSLEKIVKVSESDPAAALSMLGYASHDMSTGQYPWARIGTAEVTVSFVSREEATAGQLKVLQHELAEARAAWMTKQQGILERINKLQALTNEVAEAA